MSTDRRITILWADDEIDLLRPHVLFLQGKGYDVRTATNGYDAIDMLKEIPADLILLDENMPGLSGLETLSRIKMTAPDTPVVMITKSEEENIMDEAIGAKIADYLIKPVHPNQILSSIKKNTESRRLVSARTTTAYQTTFAELGGDIAAARSFGDYAGLYRKLVYWDMELESLGDNLLQDILQTQKNDANAAFAKFVRQNYTGWMQSPDSPETPLLSSTILQKELFPMLATGQPTCLLVIDNMRYDQWKAFAPLLAPYFKTEKELLYSAILPTVTQYARNALFAGLLPLQIQRSMPEYWTGEEEHDEGHNEFEQQLLEQHLKRRRLPVRMIYEKIASEKAGKKLPEKLGQYLQYDLIALVFNFVDQLSHARTDSDMIRQLSGDEAAYRTLTRTWFEHSALLDLLRAMAAKGVRVIITTDHGSIRVTNPVRVVGDRESSVNIRYKQGRKLAFEHKRIFEVREPASCQLPRTALTTSYIFASGGDYLIYPKNYNQFASYYHQTFQHGGISMEEMIVPFVVLQPA
ncbi:MAG: PglZ domain-containing protein [Bacteroidales bacterium]|nr:PglZ domain-containing protein [Bacteroidales bacterium]